MVDYSVSHEAKFTVGPFAERTSESDTSFYR